MFKSDKYVWDIITLEDSSGKFRPYIIVSFDENLDEYGIVPMTTRNKFEKQIRLSFGSRINLPLEIEYTSGRDVDYAELHNETLTEDDKWEIEYKLNSQ